MTIRLFIDKETDLEMSNGLLEPIKLNTLLFKVNDFLVLKFMVFHKHSPVYRSIQGFCSYILVTPPLLEGGHQRGKSHVNH